MSTGRSRSLSGPFLTFSFPLRSLLIVVSLGAGPGGLVTPVSVLPSTSPSASSAAINVCASSCEGDAGAFRSTSKGEGEDDRGVAGAESGEASMLFRDVHVSRRK